MLFQARLCCGVDELGHSAEQFETVRSRRAKLPDSHQTQAEVPRLLLQPWASGKRKLAVAIEIKLGFFPPFYNSDRSIPRTLHLTKFSHIWYHWKVAVGFPCL